MEKKAINSYTKAQTVALYNNSESPIPVNEGAKRLNIYKTCVFNTIKRHKKTREFIDNKRTGRSQKFDERDQRRLKRLVKGENRLSVSKSTIDLNQSLSKPIASLAVFNYLKKLGYEYKVKLKKQWLSATHREERVVWYKQHAHFSTDDWEKVVFSDESTFYVLEKKNQVKIWRTDEEWLHPDCDEQVNTGRGGKLGIRRGISAQEPTEARIFDENIDGQMYYGILSGELKRSMVKLYDKDKIIDQQDLAPWHTYNMLKAKMKKIKLKVLDWPAKSPDLHPNELVWSILDKKLTTTPIYNEVTFRKQLEEK